MSPRHRSRFRARLVGCGVVLALILAQCRNRDEGGSQGPAAPATGAQDPRPIPDGADRVRFWISGALEGHLEPCGCAQGQIGGLARRMFLLRQRPDQYDLRIEGGDLSSGGNELDVEKFFTSVQVLFQMSLRYDVLGMGPHDLELPLNDLTGVLSAMQVPAVASDLRCRDDKVTWPALPFREFTVRAQKVRIASFALALPKALEATGSPIELLGPEAAWQAALAGADPKTLRVLLMHAEPSVVSSLVPKLQPAPDLVVAMTDAHPEPLSRPEMHGAVPVVYPGSRGRMLLDVTLTRLADGPRVGYAIERLEGSQTSPGAMQDLGVKEAILQHRRDVKDHGVLQRMADQLPTANGSAFVGTQRCGECHKQALEVWQASKHHDAWKTLADAEKEGTRYPWPVTAYPDCVGCHTVGYRQKSGFIDAKSTPQLEDVGCEQCHGAGKAHSDAPKKVKLGKVGNGIAAQACTQCHDFEQTPDFDYKDRWRKIEHK
jgi:hypothetical protein